MELLAGEAGLEVAADNAIMYTVGAMWGGFRKVLLPLGTSQVQY